METQASEMQFYDIYDVWYTPWYRTQYCYIACGFIFLFFLYLIYRWYKNRSIPIVELSPSQKALHAIEQLKKGSYKNYAQCYSVLTQTLKIYLEQKCTIPLVGLTDDEFMKTIALQPTISQKSVQDFKIIFDGVTFIKFAGQEAQEEQLKKSLELSTKIIKETA